MKYYFLVFLVAGLHISFASTAAFSQASVINKYISKQAADEGAEEYKEARKVIYGDVNRDGQKDAVVQYTLEGFGGGNNWAQLLVVFLKKGNTYKFAAEEGVGAKLATHTSKLKSVTNNQIILTTEACPEPPQGLCEKPKKGKSIFTFSNGKLKEL